MVTGGPLSIVKLQLDINLLWLDGAAHNGSWRPDQLEKD